MRWSLVLLIAFCGVFTAHGQDAKEESPPARYEVVAILAKYPQASPKATLASILSAIEEKRIDYVLAHLTDPAFVDERVKKVHAGSFDDFVKETTTKLNDNPAAVKEMTRFLKEAEWEGGETTAVARHKDIKDKEIFMKKIGTRWFLENKQKPEPKKEDK
jgi:hypothetical protein